MAADDMRLRLVARLLQGGGDVSAFDVLNEAIAELLPDGDPVTTDDPSLRVMTPELELALDIERAMQVVEPEEPAHPWNLGGRLNLAGRALEAGYAFYEAALRWERDLPTSKDPEEDREWCEAALLNSARSFAASGQVVTAAALAARVSDPAFRDLAVGDVKDALNG